ncbi:MAG: Helix-turn-helix domain protein [Flavobacteriaceae bacterium FS1-H7996/R]|nr:MAG: Helix-turn-helix domain protein [Flavobacteriaceae bacterium FS1-H7996/R]
MQFIQEQQAINRIKVVFVEKNLSSKWLAKQLGKNEATISRWCTNGCTTHIEYISLNYITT